jgi:hypothetical protein
VIVCRIRKRRDGGNCGRTHFDQRFASLHPFNRVFAGKLAHKKANI